MKIVSPTRRCPTSPSVRPSQAKGPLARETGSRDSKKGSAMAVMTRITGMNEAP